MASTDDSWLGFHIYVSLPEGFAGLAVTESNLEWKPTYTPEPGDVFYDTSTGNMEEIDERLRQLFGGDSMSASIQSNLDRWLVQDFPQVGLQEYRVTITFRSPRHNAQLLLNAVRNVLHPDRSFCLQDAQAVLSDAAGESVFGIVQAPTAEGG